MKNEKVYVKFLEDGELPNKYQYKKDEILVIWKRHAEELVITGRAKILEKFEEYEEPKIEDFFENPNLTGFIPKKMADVLKSNFIFKTPKDIQEIYVYNDGVYEPNGEVLIRSEVRRILGDKQKKNHIEETISAIKETTYIDETEPDDNFINLENGILDLSTFELLAHNPDFFFVAKLPIIYNPNADCPKVKKFFTEIIRPEDILIIEELFGWLLIRNYKFRKGFFLIGGGFNGKSTLLELVRKFLGKDNCCHIPLQQFEERFTKIQFNRKLANIYPDMPSTALRETGTFKVLTGNDTISAEKKFGGFTNFTNYAKMIFSMNELPRTTDRTEAFFDRVIIINFPFEFRNNADPNILEKIITDEEISGLFNLALKGLERIKKNNGFSYSLTTEEVREHYIRMSDPIEAFVLDEIEIDNISEITKEELYSRFVEYCKDKKITVIEKNIFSRRLMEAVPSVRTERTIIETERVYVWKGIRFKTEEEIAKKEKISDFI